MKTCDNRYVMPKDSIQDKLLISIHYYTPWGYCGNASLSSWGTVKNYEEQNDLLSSITKFTDEGYGVVIGEYAVALNDDGSLKANTYDYISNLLSNCDLYGFVPVLWDCSNLFIRRDLSFCDSSIANLFRNRSYQVQSLFTLKQIQNRASALLNLSLTEARQFEESNQAPVNLASDQAIAWIMFNSSDWSTMYSVGDTYDPVSKTEGVIATDTKIAGVGTYTVSLDFTATQNGYADSTAFTALAIGNGELLYPGYTIHIVEVLVNDEPYPLNGIPYTTSDNQICTRVNLYNEWISKIPNNARTLNGDLTNASACLLEKDTLGQIKTLSITFDYVKMN